MESLIPELMDVLLITIGTFLTIGLSLFIYVEMNEDKLKDKR